ncbi:MAG: hypothetical protein LBF04_03575 [Prevotellaceae bacterium]|nr:hypothetical protein [Prevotellaceae bacterium]
MCLIYVYGIGYMPYVARLGSAKLSSLVCTKIITDLHPVTYSILLLGRI